MGYYSRPLPWIAGIALLIIASIAAWYPQTMAEEARAKRLIYYGWGVRDTQYVRDHWREMEQMPFDGVGITVAIDRSKPTTGDGVTGNLLGWQAMGRKPFRVEEFREAIADLKAARWRAFTDNFLPVALSPSDSAAGLNWFDEERWRIIANNFAVLAKITAEGGLKGLILDPEHYNAALFSYPSQRQQVDRPFEEYVDAARRRGRQVMTAIAAHLPQATLLSLFGYTLPLSELRPGKSVKEVEYGLLPAFYDGLLEAMPVAARLIDGYELAYSFKERPQFLKGYRQIHEEAPSLSGVPGRYREKVMAGFGLMLDYRNRPDYFTPEQFRLVLTNALEVSDGYVWLYSQGPQFFPPSRIDPSYIEALAAARQAAK